MALNDQKPGAVGAQTRRLSTPSDDDYDQDNQDSDDHSDQDQDHVKVQPGKRKRPLSASCELCKQRKVKCDRGQPACGWCSRNGAVCEYKERRKPGLRANYGRNLERRLDSLEEILKQHDDLLRIHSKALGGTAAKGSRRNHSLPSDGGVSHDAAFKHAEPVPTPHTDTSLFVPKPTVFTPSGASMAGLSAGGSASTGMDAYTPQVPMSSAPPSASRLPDMQMSNVVGDYYGTPRHNIHAPSAPLPQGMGSPDQDMPPYDLLYALVDLYFKHINTWCPILHRKSTLDSLFGPSTLLEDDRILLHAIVATTLRYSNDPRLTDERRKHYHQISKQTVLLHGIENSSVKSLQALVILALDLVGSSNGPPGWNVMALITRSVVQLGLAVESNSSKVSPRNASIYTLRAMTLPDPRDFVEDEARRRLFWMIYLLDRYATIATAFDFALNEADIDRTLPCRDDLWVNNHKVETKWYRPQDHDNPPFHTGSLGAFSFHIEILDIIAKIHQFLKQPVDIGSPSDVEQWQRTYKELDNSINHWRFTIPAEMTNFHQLFQSTGRSPSIGWIMVYATYHTAIIRLHSSAAYPTTRSPIFTPSYSASQLCRTAAESIAILGEYVVQNGLLSKLGHPFAWTLWVAARVLLVHSSTVEHKLGPQVGFFVETLREMGRYWTVAARYSELLQRVLNEQRDSERQGDGVTPSSVKILADMRRTAFDLEFLISRQSGHAASVPAASRLPSTTPGRTPAPTELEYLDVFDFFNVPRLPAGGENHIAGFAQSAVGPLQEHTGATEPGYGGMPNEFNIQNYAMDANSDWLFKQDGQKFMTQNQ